MRNNERVKAQLNKPAAKRDLGGHGDPMGFMALLSSTDELDLYHVDLPQPIKCSTCRFLVPEFNQQMPCWDCVLDEKLPKWRPR